MTTAPNQYGGIGSVTITVGGDSEGANFVDALEDAVDFLRRSWPRRVW